PVTHDAPATSPGGRAGYAVANASGVIKTSGDGADGILAQSIGGGGGIGGGVQSGALPSDGDLTISADVGGQGGDAGDGKTVTVVNGETIDTSGGDSVGIFAQSIGGGGGVGGNLDLGSVVTQGKSMADLVTNWGIMVGGSGG